MRQVTGSLTKPLEDPNALFRFHEDEKEGPLLNCCSIWFQNAREPLLVVSELLYTMLNLRLKFPNRVRIFDKHRSPRHDMSRCSNEKEF